MHGQPEPDGRCMIYFGPTFQPLADPSAQGRLSSAALKHIVCVHREVFQPLGPCLLGSKLAVKLANLAMRVAAAKFVSSAAIL